MDGKITIRSDRKEDYTFQYKGKDVTLTLDAAVQHVCEKELMKSIEKFKAHRGAVIVMNPRTGEILAYAVYPFFDPNNFKTATSFLLP